MKKFAVLIGILLFVSAGQVFALNAKLGIVLDTNWAMFDVKENMRYDSQIMASVPGVSIKLEGFNGDNSIVLDVMSDNIREYRKLGTNEKCTAQVIPIKLSFQKEAGNFYIGLGPNISFFRNVANNGNPATADSPGLGGQMYVGVRDVIFDGLDVQAEVEGVTKDLAYWGGVLPASSVKWGINVKYYIWDFGKK